MKPERRPSSLFSLKLRRKPLPGRKFLFLLAAFGALSGCEQISGVMGVESPAHKSARMEAEGKAVGGGCRQSGRAIEDCYSIYTWVPKEAVFSGWLEMDAYMRENNLETVPPMLPPVPPPETGKKKKKARADDGADGTDGEEKREGNQSAVPTGPIPVYTPAHTTSIPTPTPSSSPASPQTLPGEASAGATNTPTNTPTGVPASPSAGNPAAIIPAPTGSRS